jgi:hypothetical protein
MLMGFLQYLTLAIGQVLLIVEFQTGKLSAARSIDKQRRASVLLPTCS